MGKALSKMPCMRTPQPMSDVASAASPPRREEEAQAASIPVSPLRSHTSSGSLSAASVHSGADAAPSRLPLPAGNVVQAQLQLADLPNDVLVRIAGQSATIDRGNVRLASRRFRTIGAEATRAVVVGNPLDFGPALAAYAAGGIGHLKLANNQFGDAQLLANLPGLAQQALFLQRLDASGNVGLTDAGMAHLAVLTSLQRLDLSACDTITDTGLAHLVGLGSLQSLDLTGLFRLNGAPLAQMPQLQHLNLQRCTGISSAALGALANRGMLQHLDLSHGRRGMSDNDLALLAPLQQLRHLNLSANGRFTGTGLADWHQMPAMQHLDLMYCPRVDDANLVHLAKMPNLQHLNLSFNRQLTEAGLAHLRPLTGLQYLKLSGCNGVTDAGISGLSALTSLQHLDAHFCPQLTGAALESLRDLPALQYLNVALCIWWAMTACVR